jgi:hypothetical protein
MSYTVLRGRWCDIIVLNVHAPTQDEIDVTVAHRKIASGDSVNSDRFWATAR